VIRLLDFGEQGGGGGGAVVYRTLVAKNGRG